MESPRPSAPPLDPVYDEAYYRTYRSAAGVPYVRGEPWLEFFRTIAAVIVRDIRPRSVLDAGCAMGFLVEALRDLGVEAFGLDVSAFAIGGVREDVRPHCWVGSVVEPFPRRYDLIVCVEVLEHLPEAAAVRAVENLCRHTDDLLFSSTPEDDGDPTHLGVRPVEDWAVLFARQGFLRDTAFDATAVSLHAARFRRRSSALSAAVADYERAWWQDRRELQAHRALNLALRAENERLAGEVVSHTAARERLDGELAASRAETAEREARLTEAVEAQGWLRDKVTAAEARLLRAVETQGRLRDEVALAETRLAEAARAREALRDQLTSAIRECQDLAAELREVARKREYAEREYAQGILEQRRLAGALAVATAERQQMTEREAALRSSLAAAEDEIGRWRAHWGVVETTVTWLLAERLRSLRRRWAPEGSWRSRLLARASAGLRRRAGPPRAASATTPEAHALESSPAVVSGPPPGGRPETPLATLLETSPGAAGPARPSGSSHGTAGPRARRTFSEVLLVSGSHGSMERYRCHHVREQLALLDLSAQVVAIGDAVLWELVPRCDLVILHRTPFSTLVAALLATARRARIPVVFDVDDLVFDPDLADRIDALTTMTGAERLQFVDGMRGYRRALEACDGVLVATEGLARAAERLRRPVWVHRNALGREQVELSEAAAGARARAAAPVVIGYASGTRTHNRDFLQAAPAVEAVLGRHPHVELWVVGPLDLDPRWEAFGERVRHLDLVPWQELPAVLAEFDINLAPLEPGNPFCEAKSELKYVEAGAVGVPTVASPVGAFARAIRHGDNGLLAAGPAEWEAALERLVTDPAWRAGLGTRARADVLAHYQPPVRAAELRATLEDILGRTEIPEGDGAGLPSRIVYAEHALAHRLLDGLTGLEIGAGAHNPFGLRTRNVAMPEDYAGYAASQRFENGVDPAPVDIWASAEAIPVPDRSEDFVISSHVVEHLPDLVAALVEWDRIVRDGGYVFIIAPRRSALAEDAARPLTPLDHFIADHREGRTLDSHSVEGVPGGRMGHYHTFTPDTLLDLVWWMEQEKLCAWELVAREDVDTKVGNGFTLVFRVHHV